MVDAIFESPGEWWLPGEGSRRIPGTIRIDASGDLRIHLFDLLDDEPSNFEAKVQRPVLHGSLHNSPLPGGTELTHFNSFAVRKSFRSNGRSAETLVANRSYVGDEHLAEIDHPFAGYVAQLAGLSGWLPFTTIKRSAKGGDVRIETGPSVQYDVSVASSRLAFVKNSEVAHSEHETTVRERAHIRFALDPGVGADVFVRGYLVPMRFLLSLALGHTTKIETLDIVLEESGHWPVEVHDLEVWATARKAPSPASARPFDTLIAPPSQQELERLLTTWWAVHSRMPKAIERIFALWESPPRYVEVRFGAVSDALDLLRHSLPSSPDLRSIIEQLGLPVTTLLPAPAGLVERWQTASHRLRSGESSNIEELFRLSELVQWLMRFVLLRELGVDVDLASRAPEFRQAVSRVV